MKILAVLYRGGKAAAAEPRLLGTVENQVGRRLYATPSACQLTFYCFLARSSSMASVPWS